MNAEHPKLEQLFQGALEAAPGEERDRFLATECQGDHGLRRRVEELIQAHECAGSFLDPSSATPPVQEAGTFEAEAEIPSGRRIGHLRVLERVAEGGLCVVYLAEQLEPVRRPVALKMLKPGADVESARVRFEAERQAMAVLDHPNIARVYDAGSTSSGMPYMVLEWIGGAAVNRYADAARLSIGSRLRLFLHICAGVAHAHSRGVIHRDLKPTNILVPEYDGVAVPKIIDFGIAKGMSAPGALGLSTEGAACVQGTPGYMSPEQALGGAGDVDARADVYSLGAVLYELLTGLVPFEGEDWSQTDPGQVRRVIGLRQFQPPSVRVGKHEPGRMTLLAACRRRTPVELATALRGELDAILGKALQAGREDRYASVSDFADDVRRHLEHREVSVWKVTWVGRSRKFVRRHRAVVSAVGIVAGVLLAAGLNALFRNIDVSQAQQETLEAQSGLLVTLGLDAVKHGNAAEAMSRFAQAVRLAPADSPEREVHLRRIRMLADHVAMPLRALQLSPDLQLLEFSPDGRHLVALESGGACTVWDWVAGQVLPWSREAGTVTALDWDPQGRWLAFGLDSGAIEVRTMPTGEVIQRLATGEKVGALRFSPDARQLAAAGQTLRLWDTRQGKWLAWEWVHPEPVYGLGYSADGRRLVTACLDGKARVFDGEGEGGTGGGLLTSVHHEKGFRNLDKDRCCAHSLIQTDLVTPLFLGSGKGLLTWTAVRQLTAWDIAAGKEVGKLEGACFATRLVASPNGEWIAVTIQRGRAELRAPDAILSPAAVQLVHRERICDVAFGPADDWALTVSADQTARIWRLPQAIPLLSPLTHTCEVVHGAASGNGEWIATAQLDGLVRVWRLPRSERETRCLSLGMSGPWNVRSAPDGQRLVLCSRAVTNNSGRTVMSVDISRYEWARLELSGQVLDVDWSDNGRYLATLVVSESGESESGFGRLGLRSVKDLSNQVRDIVLPFVPTRLAWHPAGDRIAVGEANGSLWLVDLDEPTRFVPLAPASGQVHGPEEGLEFACEGRTVVRWWAEGRVEVWDLESGSLRVDLTGRSGTGRLMTVSPTGKELLMTDATGRSRLRSLEDDSVIGTGSKHDGGVMAQGFSPDGRWVVTSGHDRRVLIWDRLTGELVCPPLDHADEVFDFVFARDGSWLGTVCRDGSFHVWETRTGTRLLPVWSAGEPLFGVQLAFDGSRAVLLGAGAKIWVRDLRALQGGNDWPEEELSMLSELVSGFAVDRDPAKVMTSEEWRGRMTQMLALRPDYFRP